jgi:mannose-6-phosphate isomerase
VPSQTRLNHRPTESLLALEPQYRERVWGGDRLRRADPPIGEAWVAFGDSRVTSAAATGATLDDMVALDPAAILGEPVVARFGTRFPLIVKLLDTAEWLSVQVHPDDEQARAMVGPGENGKTEAWYFVETAPDARVLAGVRQGVDAAALAEAIRSGRALDVAAEVQVTAGSSIMIPSGTLHSLGPGILVYEVQQASDITFRAWDWNRPQSGGRRLHVDESIAVTRAEGPSERHRPLMTDGTGLTNAETSLYFALDVARVEPGTPLAADTDSASFHALTVVDGAVDVTAGTSTLHVGRFETAVVTAAAGTYRVNAVGGPATLMRASVPPAAKG